MITMTCKCGDSTIEFKNLKAEDFPEGFSHECCRKVITKAEAIKPLESPVLAKIWDTPEEDAAWAALEVQTAPYQSAVEALKPTKKNKAK